MKVVFSKDDAKEIVDIIFTRFMLFGKTGEFCGFCVDKEDFVDILFAAMSKDRLAAEDEIASKYKELQRLR